MILFLSNLFNLESLLKAAHDLQYCGSILNDCIRLPFFTVYLFEGPAPETLELSWNLEEKTDS